MANKIDLLIEHAEILVMQTKINYLVLKHNKMYL